VSIINRNARSIIARASLESSSAINSVEPLMSANSAVTVLRSPSIAPDAGASTATMISDLIEETVAEAAAFLGPIAVPHFLPNRAPGLTDALHAGQNNSSFTLHSSQHEASAVLSWLPDEQRIGSPVAPVTTTPCADGGSSTML
jgi:hypothetical protein